MQVVKILSRFLILLMLCAPLAAQNDGERITAQAVAEPSVLMAGQTGAYTIRFSHTSQLPRLNTPRVDGLEFSNAASTSTRQSLINGRLTVEVEISWQFRPVRTGTFTIPGRTVTVSGREVVIPPVQVEAVPQDAETRSRAFLRLNLPEGPVYVGQAIPARLTLYIRQDLSVANIEFPDQTSEAFLHSELDRNPRRLSLQVQGRPYQAFQWDLILTPIKAGPAQPEFVQNVVLQVPAPDDRLPSIFSFRNVRTEPYILRTDPLEVEVQPLPRENRPGDFRDAIGQFQVSTSLSATELQAGEPATLTVTLSGKGNFKRAAPPALADSETWRVYPPKTTFQPADATGYTGSKSFEFIVIPQNESVTEWPVFGYAWFDPDSGSFQRRELGPIPVTVAPAPEGRDSGQVFTGALNGEAQAPVVPESILPLRTHAGNLSTRPASLWRDPVYWIANLLTGAFLLAGALWSRHRLRLRSDARLARRHTGSRRIRKALQAAGSAAAAGDAPAFFEAARYCIQEKSSHLVTPHPESRSLVASDCLDILAHAGASESLLEQARSLLEAADAHQFAGSRPGQDRLTILQRELLALLSGLNQLHK